MRIHSIIFLLVSILYSDSASISISSKSDNQIEIYLTNDVPISGFQFDIIGVDLIPNSAFGGVAEKNFFLVSLLNQTIAGFSMTGATIPVGTNQLLTTVEFTAPSSESQEVCLDWGFNSNTNATGAISNSAGVDIESELGPCITVLACADGEIADCNGECGGSAENDECDVCGGDGTSCQPISLSTEVYFNINDSTRASQLEILLKNPQELSMISLSITNIKRKNFSGSDFKGLDSLFGGRFESDNLEKTIDQGEFPEDIVILLTGNISPSPNSPTTLVIIEYIPSAATVNGLESCITVNASNNYNQNIEEVMFPSNCFTNAIEGCMEVEACNYISDANWDENNHDPAIDKSDADNCPICDYAAFEGGYYAVENYFEMRNDQNGELACLPNLNISPDAYDINLTKCTCVYSLDINENYDATKCDCDGNVDDNCGVCGGDSDGDGQSDYMNDCGVCFAAEEEGCGCTDSEACNYDVNAITENGSCAYIMDDLDECCNPEDLGCSDMHSAEICFSIFTIDNCGECIDNVGGDEGEYSCIEGCDSIWSNDGNQLVFDDCDVCDGDNSTCCIDENACNEVGTQYGCGENEVEGDDYCCYPAENFDCNGDCTVNIDTCGECGGVETDSENCLSNDISIMGAFLITSVYPNPFNPTTTIDFHVKSYSKISINILDINGKLQEVLIDGYYATGSYSIDWTVENLSSGLYLINYISDGNQQNKKVVYMK